MIIKGVLFDLDGTLVDTSFDLIDALNEVNKIHNKFYVPHIKARKKSSDGAKGLTSLSFNQDSVNKNVTQQFLKAYLNGDYKRSQLFPLIREVIAFLENDQIPWGIVTNKPRYLTLGLLDKLNINNYGTLLCGDDLKERKPHPLPLITAANNLKLNPSDIIYVGDAERDIMAGNSAGMFTVYVDYGYSNTNETNFDSDLYIKRPLQLFNFLTNKNY
jgi:N-acetyl-D-muramate 6-phosphate phosphatase